MKIEHRGGEPLLLRVEAAWPSEPSGGPNAALYVMASSDATHAKVGVCHAVDNCPRRLDAVRRAHPKWCAEPTHGELELAVVCELVAFGLGPREDPVRAARWELLRHLESMVRFDLALRLGRLSAKPEWITVREPRTADEWCGEAERSWHNVGWLLAR